MLDRGGGPERGGLKTTQKLFLGKGNGDGHDTNFIHTYTKTDI